MQSVDISVVDEHHIGQGCGRIKGLAGLVFRLHLGLFLSDESRFVERVSGSRPVLRSGPTRLDARSDFDEDELLAGS